MFLFIFFDYFNFRHRMLFWRFVMIVAHVIFHIKFLHKNFLDKFHAWNHFIQLTIAFISLLLYCNVYQNNISHISCSLKSRLVYKYPPSLWNKRYSSLLAHFALSKQRCYDCNHHFKISNCSILLIKYNLSL